MTERKFTDEQIIKGLTCYTKDELCVTHCELFEMTTEPCYKALAEAAIDLINRQRAEIDDLKKAYLKYEETSGLKQAKAEAIKEFAERLLDKYDVWTESDATEYQYVAELVGDLVKEMTEGKQ
jgi:hypothetical protein